MTNVSSLVPMTKATLSGRNDLNKLTHSFLNSKKSVEANHIKMQGSQSVGLDSADSIKNN